MAVQTTARAYHCASQAIFAVALLVYFCVGVAFNWVLLDQVLPASGFGSFVLPLKIAFNSVWLLAVGSFLRCRFSDPGRLPDRWQAFVEKVGPALPIAPARKEWQPRKATMCNKCRYPRPERAHHCVLCGHCVLRYDHHCPWINNCVGFYNHKFFLLLSLYTWLTGFLTLVPSSLLLPVCVRVLVRESDAPGRWDSEAFGEREAWTTVILACVGLFVCALLSSILQSHLVLASRNLTSVEDFYDNMSNPFDQGSAMENLVQICGNVGIDWMLPIHPWRPVSDGVTFDGSPGDALCGALLSAPEAFGRATGRTQSSMSERTEAERESDLEEDLIRDLHTASSRIADERTSEELWRLRYRLYERRRDRKETNDSRHRGDEAATTPTLFMDLWKSFWRERKTPRKRAVWL